ncbi:hypothetical protein [Leptospira ilyithenensis]|uniref:Uncharacterized protein n=1 Tax=Leptospira ilyithenensis TaxID=2484901 RepID=A0A4R9LNE1_9LEPT|nr:hypothetical protein [Leptospira ilyithenensis]TGN10214.1 hypothetical protein EHS11_10025 [Leptospira ilyithenensis]
MKKNFLILVLIFHSCVSPVIKEQHSHPIVLGALQKEVVELSKELSKFSDINDDDRLKLLDITRVMCDVMKSKQKTFLGYPQFELLNEVKEKGKDIQCVWNFRKELIQFSMKTNGSSDWDLETNWFDKYPSRISMRFANLGYTVDRHWQWSIMRRKWESVLVFLKIEDQKEKRFRTYSFSRYAGGILKKEETILIGNESVLDGWQYDDTAMDGSSAKCTFYEKGKLSEDRRDCRLAGQIVNLPLEKINFE